MTCKGCCITSYNFGIKIHWKMLVKKWWSWKDVEWRKRKSDFLLTAFWEVFSCSYTTEIHQNCICIYNKTKRNTFYPFLITFDIVEHCIHHLSFFPPHLSEINNPQKMLYWKLQNFLLTPEDSGVPAKPAIDCY